MAYETKPKKITIKTVDGMIFSGKVNIGDNERLSDMFTQNAAPFVTVYDANLSDGRESTSKVLFVNKGHIIWAEPEE